MSGEGGGGGAVNRCRSSKTSWLAAENFAKTLYNNSLLALSTVYSTKNVSEIKGEVTREKQPMTPSNNLKQDDC